MFGERRGRGTTEEDLHPASELPPEDRHSIASRHREVLERISRSAGRVGRSEEEVVVVAVSKSFPAKVVTDALRSGIGDFGENRAQELKQKASVINRQARWHFVGHLQTNKVRDVVGLVHLIHSVDSLRLAEAIARRARALELVQEVLIEVNVSGEEAKNGVEPGAVGSLADHIVGMEGIRVRGLMTMPPWPKSPEDSRPYYKRLAALQMDLARSFPSMTELSMGMTRDFEVGVEEGATLVRVGEAIFGPRRT